MTNEQALLAAASDGSLQHVCEGLDVATLCDEHGNNALHLAVLHGRDHATAVLVSAMPHLDACNEAGETALIAATKLGRRDMALHLIEHGASVHLRAKDDCGPLYYACTLGLDAVVLRLLDAGADPNCNERLPLEGLSQCPPSVDIAPLLTALVRAGADVCKPNWRGEPVYSHYLNDDNRAHLVVANGVSNDELIDYGLASFVYLPRVLQLYVARGGNPNAIAAPKSDGTLLARAFEMDQIDSVRILAPYADVHFRGEDGSTALQFASEKNIDTPTLELLLANGSAQSSEYYAQALILALQNASLSNVAVLAAKTDLTADAYCQYASKAAYIPLLVALGADPDIPNQNGQTPLFAITCRPFEYRNAALLVRALAPVTKSALSERHEGYSVMDAGIMSGSRPVVRALVDAFPASTPCLPSEALFWQPSCEVRGYSTFVADMGWAPGHAIAYASLELAYLAVLGSVVSARHWTPSPPWPSPSTLPPPGIALLHAELDQVRNDHARMRGVRRAMARRVYFVDGASTLPSALQTSLSPLEATATWRDDVLEIVDPALYGAIYGRTRFAPRQHRFRVDTAPSIVGLSLVTESALRGVTCPVLQMLPTPILWDNTTESVTLESYINNVPAYNEAAYEALTDSLRVVLPLLDVALGLDCDDYSPHRLTRDLTSTKTLRKMYRKQRGLPQNATVSAAELDAFIKSLKLQHPSYPREGVRMSSRPWPSTFVTTAESRRQGICHVTAHRASATTSTTAWQRGSGAINEAARFTALVFYDVTNVEAQLECLESFASVCTEIDSATQQEIFLKKPRSQWNAQVTDRLPVYQGRVVLLASSVAHRLRLRALDATQPSGLKLVAWDFVSDGTGGILTTADVFPQQKGALQASLHGTWLESLLPDVFDMVVAFLGCSAISESEAQAAAAATKANRDAIVRASIRLP